MSSFLIDHLSSLDIGCLAYFFFINSDDNKNTPIAAMKSLVYQVYKFTSSVDGKDLQDDLLELLNNSGSKTAKDFQSLWDLFRKYISKLDKVTIILDALDECTGSNRLMQDLIKVSTTNWIQPTISRAT